MGRVCTVCMHPQRRQIDNVLIERTAPYSALAAVYGLSTSALYHHRVGHLRERLERAKMLDAQALAARMAELDGHIDRILEQSERTQDDRLGLLAIGEGRRNVETLMRLLIVHTAEQNDAARAAAAAGYPIPQLPDDPARIGTVLRMLIESGAALLPPTSGQEAHNQATDNHARDDDDDRPGFTISVPV